MKKNSLLLLLVACLFLTACASQNSNKSSQSTTSKTAATTETTENSTEDSTTTSSSVEDIEKVESYQYEANESGLKQIIKETLVYKGKKFLKIELHITQEADEATKANFAGYDFATVRGELLSYLEQQSFFQQLKGVSGLEVITDVTQDYSIIINIKIDMATIDLQALSNVEGVGTDFTELATVTPAAYILGLKLRGAVQVP